MTKTYFLRISNDILSEYDYKFYETIPSDEKKNRIKLAKSNISKKVYLYSDLLLKYLICRETNLGIFDLIFSKNEFGKPFLTNKTNIKYNISHTKDALAISISDNEIGIDIEKIRAIKLRVAKRFFTKNEYNYVMERDSNYRFLEIWTKKEAYMKFVGKGFAMGLNSFDTTEENFNNKYNMSTVDIDGYVISICNDQQYLNNSIHPVNEEQFIKKFLQLGCCR